MSSDTHRIVPIRGHELTRRALEEYGGSGANQMQPGEVHNAYDELGFGRQYVAHRHVGGYLYHGPVTDEAAMLALDAPGTSHACYPGDFCLRSDTGALMLCVANHGGLASDWVPVTGSGLTPADLTTALAAKASTDHTHVISAIPGLSDALAGKASTAFASGVAAGIVRIGPRLSINPETGVMSADIQGGGGAAWRTESGDVSLANGDSVIASGATVQAFSADNLSTDGSGLATVHILGIGIEVKIGADLVFAAGPMQEVLIRRIGGQLIVATRAFAIHGASYLRQLLGATGLVSDLDALMVGANDGAILAEFPAAFGPTASISRGLATVQTYGTRKGLYFGTGVGTGAIATVGSDFTIVAVCHSTHTTGNGRLIQGVSSNWLLGPYGGNWQLYTGAFQSMRYVSATDLFVVAYSRTAAAARLTWRAPDGSVATATAAVGTSPGQICIGYGAYNEPPDAHVYQVGVWSRALNQTELATLVAGLSARWALS